MPDSPDEFVIKGGRVVDATGDRIADVLVQGGVVAAVGRRVEGAPVLDAAGCLVVPGLVDLHAHLREPGDEEAETIETGARAAALGGFTAVVAMPNTQPPLDDAAVVASVLAAGREATCDVVSAGCITKGRRGEELAPMGELHALGVRIFTDDGACVADAGVMRRALEYAHALPGAVVAQHAEDPSLAGGGHMHEGAWSSRLGIPSRPEAAEAAVVARDVLLAELTGMPVHFLHLSTAAAVDLVRDAKDRGVPVTAEVAPHHFTLTDAECRTFDPAFKVHPPLRTDADVAAVKAGLADALACLSWQPAAIAGLDAHGGPVEPGRPANLCVVDPAVRWEVDPTRLASRSRNTPYAGRKLTGRVRHTVLRGEPVVVDGIAQR